MADGTQLVKFGGGAQVYAFPDYSQADYRDNFGNAVPRTMRLPGMDGGIDLYGVRRAPVEIGQVNASWTIVTYARADMTDERDSVKSMLAWGRRKLWMQPSDETDRERWCLARVNNISISEKRDQHTDLWQRVTVNWQVADPRWKALPAGEWYLDDGHDLDDGLNLNSPRFTSSTINTGSSITLTNAGNAPTPVLLRFVAGGNDVTGLTVTLVDVGGSPVAGFVVDNTFSGAYEVDSHPMPKVRLDGVSDYANFSRVAGNGFIVLEPGDNTIEISGTFADDIDLEAYFEDSWR